MYPDTSLLSGVRESIEDSFHFRAKMAPIPTSVRTSIWLLSAAYIVSAQPSAVLTWIKTDVIARVSLEQSRPRACFASH